MTHAHDMAYPQTEEVGERGAYRLMQRGGLTKREAFAMAAMQGISANKKAFEFLAEEVAGYAVQYADAILAELAKDAP